ncbi:MAG TPA: glycosyltransferase family 2 protein [Spirochaetia bacterium]|jgi:glycosyltransferase involved in cell wall biosynthesis|nr:glycosyltransferase family 2 protein [Spirochaetia bacterium]
MNDATVSVIIPVYNESKYIDRCLSSLKRQTYPQDKIEFLLVDGGSTDDTVEKIKAYYDMNIKLLHNEKRLVTYALNTGIRNSTGKYIIRMDAHAEYAEDYIKKCVYYLENTDADNVGGVATTLGEGFVGMANAEILSSKFGVGNSRFRTETESGYVDTVPFGAFRREIFTKIGLFDPELPRSEDNDFNSRIRKSGGKVYMSSDVKLKYYCRNTVGGLLSQALKNGNALFLTIRKNPKAMSLRHYIPFAFTMSLIILPVLAAFLPLFRWIFFAEVLLYAFLDIIYSFKGNIKSALYKMIMFPMFHISYGIGSVIGMFKIRLY